MINQQRITLKNNAYVQFWSSLHQQIVNGHCASVFVGHFECGGLLNHFFQFGKEMGRENRLLLHIGIDGPNINLKFKEDSRKHFEEATGQKFININTFTLHKVHTSFKNRMTALPNGID